MKDFIVGNLIELYDKANREFSQMSIDEDGEDYINMVEAITDINMALLSVIEAEEDDEFFEDFFLENEGLFDFSNDEEEEDTEEDEDEEEEEDDEDENFYELYRDMLREAEEEGCFDCKKRMKCDFYLALLDVYRDVDGILCGLSDCNHCESCAYQDKDNDEDEDDYDYDDEFDDDDDVEIYMEIVRETMDGGKSRKFKRLD